MQNDKQWIFDLVILIAFIVGGFIGTAIWLALIPLCLLSLVKANQGGTMERVDSGMHPVDYCIIGICAAELLSCVFSVNISNSIRASTPIITASFFWFFFRSSGIRRRTLHYLMAGGAYLALLFSLITIVTFIRFKSDFSTYGSSITDFKMAYTPMGMPVNDWVAFLICMLPYPLSAAFCAKNRKKQICLIIISALLTASVILSLSRGAYISLAVFYLVSIGYLCICRHDNKLRNVGLIILSAVLGLLLVIPANKEVLTTCAMSRTTSQKLSTDGRIQLLEESISIWKSHRITGAGSGNFNIVYDSSVIDRKSSSTRATNAYALILVEKGAAGILTYCGLALAVLVCVLKKKKADSGTPFFLACFAAFCVRGLFFSSMFKFRSVLMLVILLLFCLILDFHEADET